MISMSLGMELTNYLIQTKTLDKDYQIY